MPSLLRISVAVLAMLAPGGVSAACTKPNVRKSWYALSYDEKASFINSTLCLMNPDLAPSRTGSYGAKSIWEDLQIAHVAQVQFIHAVGAFFPWHRWFVTVHERFLRDQCGYEGPYPYWDEQADQAAAPLTESGIWSSDPITGFGSTNLDANGCVIDGAFASVSHDLTTNLTRRQERTCLQRGLKQDYFDKVAQTIVTACQTATNYVDMNSCLGGDPHVSGHFAVGGTMDDVSLSPIDPLFFMHHANLDRLWWQWQLQNSSRLTDIGGPNVATVSLLIDVQPPSLPVEAFLPYFDDNGNVTTLDHVMWMAEASANITIREVMDLKGDFVCSDYE